MIGLEQAGQIREAAFVFLAIPWPNIEVDPETYVVTVDGAPCTCDPAERVPLARRYVLK